MRREACLALDAESEVRNEYLGGHVVAMAGASPRHNLVTANLTKLLGVALDDGPCRVLDAGQRVRIEASGAYVYPDVTVVCADPELTEERPRSLLNPQVVIEVLSESTRGRDETAKMAHYRRLPSIQEILLVESESRRVTLVRRAGDEWRLRDVIHGEVEVPSLGVRLALDDVYAKTDGLPSGG